MTCLLVKRKWRSSVLPLTHSKHTQTLSTSIRNLIFGPTWPNMITCDVRYKVSEGGLIKDFKWVMLLLCCFLWMDAAGFNMHLDLELLYPTHKKKKKRHEVGESVKWDNPLMDPTAKMNPSIKRWAKKCVCVMHPTTAYTKSYLMTKTLRCDMYICMSFTCSVHSH